jgi:hypothetical protein
MAHDVLKWERIESVKMAGVRVNLPLQISGRYINQLTIQNSNFAMVGHSKNWKKRMKFSS